MSLRIVDDVEQGTEEWHALRRGIVTASVVQQLLTEGGKVANNKTSQALTRHLIAERITGYTEPTYMSSDMERGNFDEPIARDLYSQHIAPVTEVGFMIRTWREFRLGFSPDGLVGDEGLIEIKSRRQKKQLETILLDEVPAENMAQLQCGLLVSGRQWIDYVSYCGGMPLYVKRVFPDKSWFRSIGEAVEAFELESQNLLGIYSWKASTLLQTERIDYDLEMVF